MLPRLLDHLIWADRRTAESLAAMTPPPADAVRRYAHILGAEATWLARLAGRDAGVAVWPDADLSGCAALAARNHEELARYGGELDGEHRGRRVTYRNTRGDEFTNTVEEILHHVALHGMYHRGQVALLVREAGGTPLATDLIAYLRED